MSLKAAGLQLAHVHESHFDVSFDGTLLARYVYRPDYPQIEALKPYIEPVRTLRWRPRHDLPAPRPRLAQGHPARAAPCRRPEHLGRLHLRPRARRLHPARQQRLHGARVLRLADRRGLVGRGRGEARLVLVRGRAHGGRAPGGRLRRVRGRRRCLGALLHDDAPQLRRRPVGVLEPDGRGPAGRGVRWPDLAGSPQLHRWRHPRIRGPIGAAS